MNLLDSIVAAKQKEIFILKQQSRSNIEKNNAINKERVCISLAEKLNAQTNSGIIAEFKRKSPSKGWFQQQNIEATPVVKAYENMGAVAASVLTDTPFFGGSIADLMAVRSMCTLPLLRKDFIIDECQILEAKLAGADIVLLIAAILSPDRVHQLTAYAHGQGMEVLLEIHHKNELVHICDEVDIIGINNRDLQTFEVNIQTSLDLIQYLPQNKPTVSESGIHSVQTIRILQAAGYKGFLIGEQFMKQPNPSIAFADFIHSLKTAD
jgi:indole-3-glycerol phosphate synthase